MNDRRNIGSAVPSFSRPLPGDLLYVGGSPGHERIASAIARRSRGPIELENDGKVPVELDHHQQFSWSYTSEGNLQIPDLSKTGALLVGDVTPPSQILFRDTCTIFHRSKKVSPAITKFSWRCTWLSLVVRTMGNGEDRCSLGLVVPTMGLRLFKMMEEAQSIGRSLMTT